LNSSTLVPENTPTTIACLAGNRVGRFDFKSACGAGMRRGRRHNQVEVSGCAWFAIVASPMTAKRLTTSRRHPVSLSLPYGNQDNIFDLSAVVRDQTMGNEEFALKDYRVMEVEGFAKRGG